MSWQEHDRVSLRKEFISQAIKPSANISELCRRYKISRKTGYKWLGRFHNDGAKELADHSKRPLYSPKKTSKSVEKQILQTKEKHPYWGARKVRVLLKRQKLETLPAKSTIHKILKKHGYVTSKEKTGAHAIRFEHEAPNRLWQMDFKGHFAYERGRCHPLTILDDHSRFSICLRACINETGKVVKPILIETFRCYGIPERINVDNGSPWGALFDCAKYTTLSVWLIQLGIKVSYSRPRHPQTNGKEERFHRTLKTELLDNHYFRTIKHIQQSLNEWREIYNLERPHEGIGMQVPSERYQPSYRRYPEKLPEVIYSTDYDIRQVDQRGRLVINGRQIFVGIPFSKKQIGLRETIKPGVIEFYYSHQKLGVINMGLIAKNTITNLYSGRTKEL